MTYDISNGWGDTILLWRGWIKDSKVQKVYGFKQNIPQYADLLRLPMKSGKIMICKFIHIERAQGVSDMFFADVKCLGYEGEEPFPEDKNWLVDLYCKIRRKLCPMRKF